MPKFHLFAPIHPSCAVLCFFIGIIFGDLLFLVTSFCHNLSFFWLFLSALLLITALLFSCPATLILALSAGFILINFRTTAELQGQRLLSQLHGQTILISGDIAADPDLKDARVVVKLKNLHLNGQHPLSGTLFVQLPPNRKLQRSDHLVLQGKLQPGFGTYVGLLTRPRLLSIRRPEPGDLFLTFRNNFARPIRQYIPSPAVDLGLGYLLGIRSGLPSSLNDLLRVVGLTHIVVASGTHLSILVGFVRQIFGRLSRFASLFFSIFLILGFVGVIGPTPSMLRASSVSILSLIAWYVGRKFQPLRLIIIVAALTLCFDPMFPLSLGWLLSIASFSGILLLSPIIIRYFYGQHAPGLLGSTIIATLSASLLCNPILLFYFGSLSLLSIFANLLILPTISLAIALVFLTGMFSFLPFLAQIIGFCTTLLLNYHIAVVNFLGQQSNFLIQISPHNPLVFLLYLPAIFIYLTSVWYNSKHGRSNSLASQPSYSPV